MSGLNASLENLNQAFETLEVAIEKKQQSYADAQIDMFAHSPEQDNAPSSNVSFSKEQMDKLAKALDCTISNIESLLEETDPKDGDEGEQKRYG